MTFDGTATRKCKWDIDSVCPENRAVARMIQAVTGWLSVINSVAYWQLLLNAIDSFLAYTKFHLAHSAIILRVSGTGRQYSGWWLFNYIILIRSGK